MGALFAGIQRVGKVVAGLHQAVHVIQRLRFTRVFLLERVDLDVIDGARLDFVGVALVGAVVAREEYVSTMCTVLNVRTIIICY